MNNYYISFNAEQDYTAWYKATVDVEFFLNSIGFTPIPIKLCIENMKHCLKTHTKKGNDLIDTGIILIQYPRAILEGFDLDKLIKIIKSDYRNYKLVAIVHDLDSVRFGNFFLTNYLPEARILNKFDYLITVNDSMADLLKQHGVTADITSMIIFDYALPNINYCQGTYNPNNVSIAYTGNLKYKKSPFIYKLDKVNWGEIKINLYGPEINLNKIALWKNINYKGALPADDLASIITEDFGLCWDGTNVDKCEGKIGQYLKYTNPHKTSFYLALGIPVIISKDISTAEFIEKEHVGITIDKLQSIPSVINQLSIEEYNLLKENAQKISEKLREGYFLKNAITKIEKFINS